jgi:hypothetical protein
MPIDINKLLEQRQEIDRRRRPATDFQKKVLDKNGNEKWIWNPAVGGEAAFKEQNQKIDDQLKAFDEGPQGKMLKAGAAETELTTNALGKNQRYLEGPTHDWYRKYGGEPAALIPGVVSTMFNRFADTPKPGASTARILTPYIAEGLATGLLGYGALKRAGEIEKTDPEGADVDRFWGNVGEGWGAGSVLGGIFKAAKGAPPEEGSGGGSSNDAVPPKSQGPSDFDLRGRDLRPKEAAVQILNRLGIPPGKDLAENRKIIESVLNNPNTPKSVVDEILASHDRFNPRDISSVSKAFSPPYRRLPGLVGAGLLGGAALSSMYSTPAEARSAQDEAIQSALRAAKGREEGPGGDGGSSGLDEDGGIRLPPHTGRFLGEVANEASYLAPYVGPARLTADVGRAAIEGYNPSDEDLADSEYWDQGRKEIERRDHPMRAFMEHRREEDPVKRALRLSGERPGGLDQAAASNNTPLPRPAAMIGPSIREDVQDAAGILKEAQAPQEGFSRGGALHAGQDHRTKSLHRAILEVRKGLEGELKEATRLLSNFESKHFRAPNLHSETMIKRAKAKREALAQDVMALNALGREVEEGRHMPQLHLAREGIARQSG